jgi:hypothetical protein
MRPLTTACPDVYSGFLVRAAPQLKVKEKAGRNGRFVLI